MLRKKQKTLLLPFYPYVLRALLLDSCLCDAYDVFDAVCGVVCDEVYGEVYGAVGDEGLALVHTELLYHEQPKASG